MTLSQAELEERAKRDVEQARARREEAALKEFQLKEAEEKRKTVASGRWDGVAADRSRLLRSTKVWMCLPFFFCSVGTRKGRSVGSKVENEGGLFIDLDLGGGTQARGRFDRLEHCLFMKAHTYAQ